MLVFRSLKLLPAKCVVRKPPGLEASTAIFNQFRRNFADTPKRDPTRQVMVHGTENEAQVRVRRARPADAPRVIRFVKDNARLAWPGFVSAPNTPNQIILSDYVGRTLAQGHTMLAEQQMEKRGWSQIRGLALSASVCPWDAALLEKWAQCVQCSCARKMMLFTAHCLRAPQLHDKYRVHNILQVVLMVPPDVPKCEEIVQMLARNSIQRGRELGFSLLRFDVTEDVVLWIDYTQKQYSALRVQYNNAFRMLMGLPRYCSASGMFADARVDCFYTVMRKRYTSLVRRVRASSNGILRAFADRAKALEGLQLKKEYEFNYEILPNVIKLYTADINSKEADTTLYNGKVPQITVYTSFPLADAET